MAGLTDGRVLTCVIRSFFRFAYRVTWRVWAPEGALWLGHGAATVIVAAAAERLSHNRQ
jgi:hypothetical protein